MYARGIQISCWLFSFGGFFSCQYLVAQPNPILPSVIASPSSLQVNRSERLVISVMNIGVPLSARLRYGDALELYFSLTGGEIVAPDGQPILMSSVFRDGDWAVDTSNGLNPIRLVYKGVDQLWPSSDSISVPLQIRPPTHGPLGLVALHVPTDGRFGKLEWQITPIEILDSSGLPTSLEVGVGSALEPRLHDFDNRGMQPRTAATGSQLTSPILESDVLGLVPDLTVRAVRGPGYSNSRTAIINDSGQLEGAVGNASDCVHVDGTSGPCSGGYSFADKEVPSGTIDGINVIFTVRKSPNPTSSLHLFRNGILQKEGVDYAISGSTVTFTSASTPLVGDIILASYRY
jgi:hypothetical protein